MHEPNCGVEFPPEIVRKLETKRVQQGDRVQLACTIRSQQPFRVEWYKGHQKLSENDSSSRYIISVKQKAGIHMMTILNAQRSDEDLYKCKAIGNEESATSSCYLLVDSLTKPQRANSLSPTRQKMALKPSGQKRARTPQILDKVTECEEVQETSDIQSKYSSSLNENFLGHPKVSENGFGNKFIIPEEIDDVYSIIVSVPDLPAEDPSQKQLSPKDGFSLEPGIDTCERQESDSIMDMSGTGFNQRFSIHPTFSKHSVGGPRTPFATKPTTTGCNPSPLCRMIRAAQ
ncbi:hypothetical protein ACOME3_005379 [Neoechinorhynchus agilis]